MPSNSSCISVLHSVSLSISCLNSSFLRTSFGSPIDNSASLCALSLGAGVEAEGELVAGFEAEELVDGFEAEEKLVAGVEAEPELVAGSLELTGL